MHTVIGSGCLLSSPSWPEVTHWYPTSVSPPLQRPLRTHSQFTGSSKQSPVEGSNLLNPLTHWPSKPQPYFSLFLLGVHNNHNIFQIEHQLSLYPSFSKAQLLLPNRRSFCFPASPDWSLPFSSTYLSWCLPPADLGQCRSLLTITYSIYRHNCSFLGFPLSLQLAAPFIL